jgi:hypothetical protein
MKWFAFKAHNTPVMHGYGTFLEARRYQDYLNTKRLFNQYTLTSVKDPTAINRIEFNLRDELDELFR